jgi:hypothetical protein
VNIRGAGDRTITVLHFFKKHLDSPTREINNSPRSTRSHRVAPPLHAADRLFRSLGLQPMLRCLASYTPSRPSIGKSLELTSIMVLLATQPASSAPLYFNQRDLECRLPGRLGS